MFKLKEGDYYSFGKIRKALDKVREVYGIAGFWQWTPDVELAPRGIDPQTGEPIGPEPPPPIVDVTIRMVEGKQFFVNRITFLGNTTTHDNVARREMRVVEGGVFNTEALKESVRRLNQLGYFKPLEGKEDEMQVTPTPGKEGQVDIKPQVRGAESQPDFLRRRRVAVRGLLRAVVVSDVELPGPWRNVRRLAAARVARPSVLDFIQRAVPVRSADHGRRRSLRAPVLLSVSVPARIRRG